MSIKMQKIVEIKIEKTEMTKIREVKKKEEKK